MRSGYVRLIAAMLFAPAAAGCVQAMRYDLTAPTSGSLAATHADLGSLICVAGKGVVSLGDKQLSDTEICGSTWSAESDASVFQCFPLASVTHVIVPRVVTASAFEPLQGPTCESERGA